jgi:hypothetical protein
MQNVVLAKIIALLHFEKLALYPFFTVSMSFIISPIDAEKPVAVKAQFPLQFTVILFLLHNLYSDFASIERLLF